MALSFNDWLKTDLGSWWVRQVQRVSLIISGEVSSSAAQRRVAFDQLESLQKFKIEVLERANR